MIKIKHFLDPVEKDDGKRLWVEPIGLVPEFREMCRIDELLTHIGPPLQLWHWFGEHPEAYDFFRAHYHETLARGPYRAALQALVCAAQRENMTLIHQGDDPQHNSATALYEFLTELEAYCRPDDAGGGGK